MAPSGRHRRYITVHPEAPPVHRPPRCRLKDHPRHGPTMDALVGAGGWGYFSGGLEAYARGFRFVEVNVSFYRRIPEATARRWRSRVPDDFVFAIKSNQAITHTDRLRASARARAAFSHDLRIACIPRSPFLLLEPPPGLRFEAAQVAGLRERAGMSGDGLRLG